MKVLLTGASGFIGTALLQRLSLDYDLTACTRKPFETPENVTLVIKDMLQNEGWNEVLKGVDVIVHTAGRAHILKDQAKNSLDEFRKVNYFATLKLAKNAADAGVKRFIFFSSIGVLGNTSKNAFTETTIPHPHNHYAITKLEAEKGLIALGRDKGMEIVVIRPPLVYARHAPGNFGRLLKWVNKGVPLPFGAIKNSRSLVALDNVVDFTMLCLTHPKAANEIFLISDNDDVSTTKLLQKVGKSLGKSARLVPVPMIIMKLVSKLIGKADMAERLFSSLQVDSSKARNLLGWKPVVTMDEQLRKTVEAYKK